MGAPEGVPGVEKNGAVMERIGLCSLRSAFIAACLALESRSLTFPPPAWAKSKQAEG